MSRVASLARELCDTPIDLLVNNAGLLGNSSGLGETDYDDWLEVMKVNSLAPALVLFNEHDDEDYREKTLQKSLMQREGGLDEFQPAIDYLLSSSYVTGRILPMDGGRHLC